MTADEGRRGAGRRAGATATDENPARARLFRGSDLRPLHIEAVLAVCAVVFLAAYSYEVLARPTGTRRLLTEIALWTTWGAFAVDWVVAFAHDRDKRAHVGEHLFGLLVVVLPTFAPLRALRLVSLFVFLQRLLVRSPIRVTVVWYAVFSSALLLYVCSLAVLELEQAEPESQLHDLGTALWWAIVTVTTVGYGDVTPVSGGGRLIAAVLMISGIALLGVVTATLASWLVDRVAEESERTETSGVATLLALREEVGALREELAAVRAELSEHHAATSGDEPESTHPAT